jgi:hypothetical protein
MTTNLPYFNLRKNGVGFDLLKIQYFLLLKILI